MVERPYEREVTSLGSLEMRVALLQEHLSLLDANEQAVGLERRAAQCRSALDCCSRCDFGPEMRNFLEMKILKLEDELSLAFRDGASGGLLLLPLNPFGRTMNGHVVCKTGSHA